MPHCGGTPSLRVDRGSAGERQNRGQNFQPGRMTDSGTATKQPRLATQPFDLTSPSKQRALAGLLVRRYRWGLSAAAFFVFGFSLAIVFVAFALESYPLLAITSPVPSDTLIVDEEETVIEAAACLYVRFFLWY